MKTTREHIGFSEFAPPDFANCVRCDTTVPYAQSHGWPRLTNVPDYLRKPGEAAIAYGWCPACFAWQRTAYTLPVAAAKEEKLLF